MPTARLPRSARLVAPGFLPHGHGPAATCAADRPHTISPLPVCRRVSPLFTIHLRRKCSSASEYLPKKADWESFFAYLVKEANAEMRLRTYWYVVDEIDFWPYGISRLLKNRDFVTLDRVIRQHRPNCASLDAITDASARQAKLESIAQNLVKTETFMKRRFEGWQEVQNGIAQAFDSVEFRRAGSIRMNLFTQAFGQEKGVDVKLATDVLKLNEIYDVGIIVSGDGDYVPAVQVVKDWGKHIINVSFLKKSGGLLPGGARRLNQATDRAVEVSYDDMNRFMKISAVSAAPAAVVAVAVVSAITPPIP